MKNKKKNKKKIILTNESYLSRVFALFDFFLNKKMPIDYIKIQNILVKYYEFDNDDVLIESYMRRYKLQIIEKYILLYMIYYYFATNQFCVSRRKLSEVFFGNAWQLYTNFPVMKWELLNSHSLLLRFNQKTSRFIIYDFLVFEIIRELPYKVECYPDK